ncbi:MAG TPA: DUF427 domain-containing protein [Arthrobacter sp.]
MFEIAEPRPRAALSLRQREEHLRAGLSMVRVPRIRITQKTVKGKNMVRAIWNGKVIAESEDTVVVEGNHYFPREAVNPLYLKESDMYSVCPWKGQASYHTLEVDGQVNVDAAWFYSEPKKRAAPIKDRIAFWRGVRIEK